VHTASAPLGESFRYTAFTAQAVVFARTASVVRKNALPDRAMPTRNLPTTVKPCSKPDSCRLSIKPSTTATTCTLAVNSVSSPSLSSDNNPPKRPSARFPRVMSALPPRSDLSETLVQTMLRCNNF